MPGKKQPQKQKANRKTNALARVNPSANKIEYRGPLRVPKSINQASSHTVEMAYMATVTSDGGGVVASVFANSPNNCNNFSGFAGAFDEFRTLAFTVKWIPIGQNTGNIGTSLIGRYPLLAVVDHDASTPLTSYVQGAEYESVKVVCSNQKLSITARMSDANESTYQNTNPATVVTYWIKFYATNFPASTVVGYTLIKYLVQFRGVGY